MKRNIVGSTWGRTNRNGINDNFEFLFKGTEYVNALSAKADNVLKKAERTNAENVSVQKQIDNIIIESGTSDAEVLQARVDSDGVNHTTVKARIDNDFFKLTESLNGRSFLLSFETLSNISDAVQSFYNSLPESSTFKIPSGVYEIDKGIVFDRKINLDMTGVTFIYTGDGTALQIGSESKEIHETQHTLPKLIMKTTNWDEESSGLKIVNIYSSIFYNVGATGFKKGVIIEGANGIGNSYNAYHLSRIVDNQKSLTITSHNSGWCNENNFHSGRFGWTTSMREKMTKDNVHVLIEREDYSQNNNRFWGCSFESGVDSGVEFAVYIQDGRMNYFYACRYEGVKKIHLQAHTDTKFIDGFGLENVTFTGHHPTLVSTVNSVINQPRRGTKFRNSFSDHNSALDIINTSNKEVVSLMQNGDIKTLGKGVFPDGIRLYSPNEDNHRGIYTGMGEPEGVLKARPGSLYLNVSGGQGRTIFIKESGSDEAGWRSLLRQEAYSAPSVIPNYRGQMAITSAGRVYISKDNKSVDDWVELSTVPKS